MRVIAANFTGQPEPFRSNFLRMCENQNPATGETLTQRLNTTRTEGGENTANRRIFYDFTFSPPK